MVIVLVLDGKQFSVLLINTFYRHYIYDILVVCLH